MGKRMTDDLLENVSRYIEANMGLSFPKEKWADLEKGLHSVYKQFGCENEETLAWQIMSEPLSKQQIEILACALTIGETYFFREKSSLDAFLDLALSEIIRMRQGENRYLRIWSAGCASGEEPYTIAMILKMLLPDLKEWNIFILATDINPLFLEKARKGLYTRWSFRDVPEDIIRRFFIERGQEFEVFPEIKDMITFSYLNLTYDKYPSLLNNTNAMDVIFCRNVLMYFSPKSIKSVAQNFYNCLIAGGWLIVSQTELNNEYFYMFGQARHGGALLYRKSGARAEEKKYKPETTTTIGKAATGYIQKNEEIIRPYLIEKKAGIPYQTVEKEKAILGQAEELYKSASRAFEHREYDYAEELLTRLLVTDHNHARALSLLARVCANQGRLDDALRYIEDSIKADNINPGSHYLHSAILKEKGLKQEAMASLKKAIYLDTDFALAYFAMGNLALATGNMAEAKRHLNNALMLLKKHDYNEILPESDGISAGRLVELIESMKWRNKDR